MMREVEIKVRCDNEEHLSQYELIEALATHLMENQEYYMARTVRDGLVKYIRFKIDEVIIP